MASPRRNAKHSIGRQLQEQPYRFTFVQAIGLIEKVRRRLGSTKQPIGGDGPPTQEVLRIVGDAALSFPGAEVLELKNLSLAGPATGQGPATGDGSENRDHEAGNEPAPVLTAALMGIYGSSGVLPYFDTQRIIDTGLRKNAEKDLLDLFNHRILSYFYRACIKYRVQFAYEAYLETASSSENLLTSMLWSIAGMATPGLQRRLSFPDELTAEFCQFLGVKSKNALSLSRMLQSYFGHTTMIQQFQGQWLTLSSDARSDMPTRKSPLGQNCQLGLNFIIGDRVWDVQSKFRVRLGPLLRHEFNALLPGSERLTRAAQLIRLYSGVQLDFDIQLELAAREVPECVLDGRSSRLGMNSWLITNPPLTNKDEAIFTLFGQPTF